jgi:hypothetical protein
VSPGVVHLSYSVAILLSLTLGIWRALRDKCCKLRDVNGVQGCAVVMLLVGRAVNMRRVVIGGAKRINGPMTRAKTTSGRAAVICCRWIYSVTETRFWRVSIPRRGKGNTTMLCDKLYIQRVVVMCYERCTCLRMNLKAATSHDLCVSNTRHRIPTEIFYYIYM